MTGPYVVENTDGLFVASFATELLARFFVEEGTGHYRFRTPADAQGEAVERHPYSLLQAAIHADPGYAWALFCNIAVPIMDAADVSHEVANETGAHLMQHLFEYDITAHEYYQYGKSGAQSYAEFRIEADREEDAALLQPTQQENSRGE